MPATLSRIDDVFSLLEQGADLHGDAIALETVSHDAAAFDACDGKPFTHRELFSRVRFVASRLRSHGVLREDASSRVAIVLPNGPSMSLALLAASVAGIAVPFNPTYQADEYEAYFLQTGVRFLVALDGDAGPAVQVADRLGIRVLRPGRDLAAGPDRTEPRTPGADDVLIMPSPHDVALILLTSGSTGRGKVVPLTHRNLCASAEDVRRSVDLGPSDRVLSMWEQFHIGGIVDLLLAPLLAGGTVISAGSFNAQRFFELLRSREPTWFQGVPTTLRELCQHAKTRGIRTSGSSLRFLRSVAAALPEAWMLELEERFGVPVIQTFGMTEASPLITSTRLPPHARKPGSAGSHCGPTVRIMDDHGHPLPPGKTGQIAVMGDNIFAGYEADPEANASAFRDGWFYTGDVGHLDEDGDLFLTGRVKELINRGGEKVSPQEVDDVLLRHPDVEQAAVFGIPHPTLGEEVAAAVVLRSGRSSASGHASPADEAALRVFASEHLAAFKVPRRILFLESLPRCPVGKVRRRELADFFGRQPQRHDALAAPTNGLEARLAAIWADELDVPAIGIDDDFALAGGDSLSSVRIVLAAEVLSGCKIPDALVHRFHTVRSMAAALAELGCPTEPPFAGGAASNDRDNLLDAVTAAMVGREKLSPTLLCGCRTLLAFDTARHVAENISTPAELESLIAARGGWAGLFEAPLTALEITRRRHAMRRAFHRVVRRADRPMLWTREAVADHADLFHAACFPTSLKTLVVGFSSRAMRLTTPTYIVLCALAPDAFDLLLLRDPGRRHYQGGVPGIGDTIEAAAEWLGAYARERGYRRAVALGTSSGGMPAIAAAVLNGWPRVLASGADRPSTHPHLQRLLRACRTSRADAAMPKITLAYSARNERDTAGAAEIQELFPEATLAPDVRFKDHALLYQLHLKGELSPFLATHLGSPS